MAVPTDYSDLRLWLKADAFTGLVDGQEVPSGLNAGWPDQSGLNFHYTAAGTPRPTYETNEKNGLPVVRFNGTTAYFDKTGNPFSGFSAGMIFVLMKRTADVPTDGAKTGLWNYGSAADLAHYPWTDGNIYDDWGSTTRKSTGNPTVNLATWHIYSVETQAGGWKSRLNGTQHFNTATNTVGFDSYHRIGAAGNVATKFEGDMAEIIGYSRILSDSERAGILAYLDGKWALGLGFAQQTVSVSFATESDMALPILAAKAVLLGQPNESDEALPVTAIRAIPLGTPEETDEALSVVPKRVVDVGIATEGETALPITAIKVVPVGQATETESALGVAGAKVVPVGQAEESDDAHPMGNAQVETVGQASESDVALPINGSKTVQVGMAFETEEALPITPIRVIPVGIATEADSATPVAVTRVVLVGQASEVDIARPIITEFGSATVGTSRSGRVAHRYGHGRVAVARPGRVAE